MENSQEIISRLKFIGRIKPGEKINTKYMFVQQNNIYTSIYRTIFNRDSRQNALQFIQETLYRAYDLITILELTDKESNKMVCFNILKDLENVKIGITNLKETYISDIKFCCDIDTILQHLDAKVTEIKNTIPITFVNNLEQINTKPIEIPSSVPVTAASSPISPPLGKFKK